MSLFTHALTPEDLTAQKDRLYASILLNEGVVDVAGDAFEVLEDTGSNLNVRIGSGTVGDKAVVEGDSTADQGNYVVISADATDTVTLSAGDNSDPRIDRVGILVQDDEADSSGQSEAILTVVEGTPASSPSAPAEPDNFLTLATVEVAAQASAVTNSDITDERVEVRLTRASRDDGPRGVLGRGTRTTNQTGIGSSPTDLTSLSVTVNVAAGRLIRVSGQVLIQQRGGGGTAQVQIHEDGVGEIQRIGNHTLATNEIVPTSGFRLIAPSEGSHTYKLMAVTSGGTTVDAIAATTRPNQIVVEDVGPA